MTSFAFSSRPTAVDGDNVTVKQERQLSVMDIVGVSSTFFPEIFQNLLATWRVDPDNFFKDFDAAHEDLVMWFAKVLPDKFLKKFRVFRRICG